MTGPPTGEEHHGDAEVAPVQTDHAPADAPGGDAEVAWQRLSARMIWVDVVQSLLSLTPGAVAIWVVGVEPSWGNLWPLIAVAVFGVFGAIADALRWVFTRYRVTRDEVQRRTGLFVRRYRSVRRDRIRSVDATAKLRHRLSGLRVVTIGAGQQSTTGEAAFLLNALTKADAEQLRRVLLGRRAPSPRPAVAGGANGGGDTSGDAGGEQVIVAGRTAVSGVEVAVDDHVDTPDDAQVFARLRYSWVFYNMFNFWAYVIALGLLWASYWLTATFGFDMAAFVAGLADWEALGWGWTIAIAVGAVGVVGVVGLTVSFFTENWRFELARVDGAEGTVLRTRRGLLQTREVNRDERRMRGMSISEPLLWRWMRMADTEVVTTGLDLWSMAQPSTILPRGPLSVARRVAAAVLSVQPSPLEVTLPAHPRPALRRRLWWATAVTATITGLLVWLATTGVVPGWTVWIGAGLWPLALLCAHIAYRALGHAIVGPYLVVRSGLLSRSTSALKRDAVSTIALRQSVLQRRLGLTTVSAMTAAGWGIYEAPDLDADEAVAFAAAAAPGLLDPFLEERAAVTGSARP